MPGVLKYTEVAITALSGCESKLERREHQRGEGRAEVLVCVGLIPRVRAESSLFYCKYCSQATYVKMKLVAPFPQSVI